jgi:hypothetical protein
VQADEVSGARVDYANDTHRRIGGTVGVVLGASRRTHVFGYLNERSRSFEVTATEAGVVTTQRSWGPGTEIAKTLQFLA